MSFVGADDQAAAFLAFCCHLDVVFVEDVVDERRGGKVRGGFFDGVAFANPLWGHVMELLDLGPALAAQGQRSGAERRGADWIAGTTMIFVSLFHSHQEKRNIVGGLG